MDIIVRTHYHKKDKKFAGDYFSVEILIDGRSAITYGDSYDDKGREKAQGFIDALDCLNIVYTKKEERVADKDY